MEKAANMAVDLEEDEVKIMIIKLRQIEQQLKELHSEKRRKEHSPAGTAKKNLSPMATALGSALMRRHRGSVSIANFNNSSRLTK